MRRRLPRAPPPRASRVKAREWIRLNEEAISSRGSTGSETARRQTNVCAQPRSRAYVAHGRAKLTSGSAPCASAPDPHGISWSLSLFANVPRAALSGMQRVPTRHRDWPQTFIQLSSYLIQNQHRRGNRRGHCRAVATADWVILLVRTILFEMRRSPSSRPSLCRDRSRRRELSPASRPQFLGVFAGLVFGLAETVMLAQIAVGVAVGGMATPMLETISRCASRVEFSAITETPPRRDSDT